MKTKPKHPEWVLAHKRPKTEVRLLNGTYYLYEVSSKWDPQIKRSRKITGKLLGKITPEGFFESDKNRLRKFSARVLKHPPSIKEFGASNMVLTYFTENVELLKSSFEDIWKEIVSLAFIRLVYHAPIKNTGFLFEKSFLSELFNDITLGERRTGALYRILGTKREQAVSYMKSFITSEDHVLIDATNIISYSERIGIAHVGYNSKREYDPQINLMMMFSSRMQMPVYYRVIPGDIREVSAFKTTLDECGCENVTIIADKGFYSEDNIEALESFNAKYIIPLRRSSMLIDYSRIEKKEFEGFFVFQGRYIWHTAYKAGIRQVHLFLDNNLMSREEADYLSRITTHPEKYSLQDFMEKRGRFGTIALLTNKTGSSSQDIYEDYKVRNQVETMIDAMKNILMADTSYMQNEDAFNGWMFINFIALQFYYRIYMMLKENKLISKYSPKDLLMLLEHVRKAKINNEWVTCEINANTKKLIEKLGLKPIT